MNCSCNLKNAWTVTCASNLLKWSRWTKRSLTIGPCHEESNNTQHFTNCPYLSLTKTIAVTNRICEDDLHLNVRQTLFINRVLLTRKRKFKHRIWIQMNAWFIHILLYISTGMRFGLTQVKTGMCHILSRFEVAPCKDTPVTTPIEKKSFLLTVGGELPLIFKRIQLWHYIHVDMMLYITV